MSEGININFTTDEVEEILCPRCKRAFQSMIGYKTYLAAKQKKPKSAKP